MDTSEPSSSRQEEEEESGSEGAEVEEDTLASLDACSQELFSSQEGSQSQRLVLGEGQTPEDMPDATLRSQPSVLSPAERLQRIRKRPHESKKDMLHEVMQQSLNENQKGQERWESERRIRQQNAECRHQSAECRQQNTETLISIMEHQADSIQALIARQVAHYRARPSLQPLSQNSFPCAPMSPPTHFPQIQVLITTSCLQHCSFTTQPCNLRPLPTALNPITMHFSQSLIAQHPRYEG
ncbi:uncharacterized protein [Lepidochelys kempii]|uniref:uncharacterized protein n=1 Tax=Lepidochelys kempii TaxID=8472 RepID=UPI003C6FA8A3